jgi:hypothetical protein
MDALTPAEREMIQLARQCGMLGPQEDPRPELLAFALAIVHACAQIGDGYWRDDASAGQHIRAAYYP